MPKLHKKSRIKIPEGFEYSKEAKGAFQKRVRQSWKLLKAKLKKDKALRKRYDAIVKMVEKNDAK